jgi:hypothetical protein
MIVEVHPTGLEPVTFGSVRMMKGVPNRGNAIHLRIAVHYLSLQRRPESLRDRQTRPALATDQDTAGSSGRQKLFDFPNFNLHLFVGLHLAGDGGAKQQRKLLRGLL